MAEESDLLQLNEDEQLAYAIFLSNEAAETNNTTEETESETALQDIEPPPTYEEAVQNQNENDLPSSPPNEFLNEDEQLAYAIWLSVNGDGVESSQTQVVYESPNSDETSESDSEKSEENSDLNHSSRNVYIENAVIRRDADADEARQRRRLENLRRRRNEWANANIGSAAAIKQDDDKRDPSPSKDKSDKKNSVNVGHANALKGICYAIKRCRLMGVNAANANAVGAVAGASADARGLNVNAANANAVGASATASANATGVNLNAGNVSARGVSASATASVTGVDVAAGNVSATAVDLSAGAHVTGARAAVGNASVTGTGAGAHLNVEGAGFKAFNVNVGGPKAKVCVNVSGPSVSFGNIDIGLTPTLNLGLNFGLDLGIPFLGSGNSGGGGSGANPNNTNDNGTGQQGNNGDNNDNSGGGGNDGGGNDGGGNGGGGGGDGGVNNPGDNNGINGGFRGCIANLEERFPNRQYLYNIHGEQVFRTDYKPDGKVFEYEKNNDKKPVDFERDKNIPKCDCEDHKSTPNENGDRFVGFRGMASERNAQLEGDNPPTANNNSSWGGGKYSTEDPSTAAGYTYAKDCSVQPINRAYTSADTPIYYTRTPLDRPEAEVMLNEVSRITDGQFTFGGPQSSSNELRSSEFITKPLENFRTEPSLHESANGYDLNMYHEGEINAERIIPDEYVSMPNRVQEQPYQNGYEYENIIDEAKKKKKEEESSDEEIDDKPNCNHAKNVMCFNCMNKGSGAKITKLSKDSDKKIYGFKND